MMHPGAPGMASTPMPGQAPPSPEKLALLELPTWEEVEALLQNPVHREFRLDIETDSTVRMNDDAEKEARVELVTAVGGFLDKAVMAGAQAPEIIPMLGELMMFAIRSFKSARPIEQAFEDAMDALQKAASQPRPNPELQKAQMEGQVQLQIADRKAQLDKEVAQAKEQAQAQRDQIQQQLEAARASHDADLTMRLEKHKADMQAQTDAHIQELKNRFDAERVQFETASKERIELLKSHTDLAVERMKLDHAGQQADKDRQHQAQEGDKNRQHEAHEGDRQRQHERNMPKPGGKSANGAAK